MLAGSVVAAPVGPGSVYLTPFALRAGTRTLDAEEGLLSSPRTGARRAPAPSPSTSCACAARSPGVAHPVPAGGAGRLRHPGQRRDAALRARARLPDGGRPRRHLREPAGQPVDPPDEQHRMARGAGRPGQAGDGGKRDGGRAPRAPGGADGVGTARSGPRRLRHRQHRRRRGGPAPGARLPPRDPQGGQLRLAVELRLPEAAPGLGGPRAAARHRASRLRVRQPQVAVERDRAVRGARGSGSGPSRRRAGGRPHRRRQDRARPSRQAAAERHHRRPQGRQAGDGGRRQVRLPAGAEVPGGPEQRTGRA